MMQDTHWKCAKLNAIIKGVLLEPGKILPFLFLFPQKNCCKSQRILPENWCQLIHLLFRKNLKMGSMNNNHHKSSPFI